MAELNIFGPLGNPDAPPSPKRYTEIPWDEVKAKEPPHAIQPLGFVTEPRIPRSDWQFSDDKANDAEDVFGESNEVRFGFRELAGPQSTLP